MFGFAQKRKDAARAYVQSVRPSIDALMQSLPNSTDAALAEMFGGIFLLYLARESSAEFKKLRPLIAEVFLDSLQGSTVAPKDRPKRLEYISLNWSMLESDERGLRKKNAHVLNGLLKSNSVHGLLELSQTNPDFEAQLKRILNNLISQLKLSAYRPFPSPAAQIHSLPPVSENTITLRDETGKPVDFQFLDLISYQQKKYVCLLKPGEEYLTVFEVRDNADDTASYLSPDDATSETVFKLFAQLHPEMIG